MSVSNHPTHRDQIRAYRQKVDTGSLAVLGGGILMWRSIKAVSQLLVILFAMYGGLTGALSFRLALAATVVVYLGAEGAEAILAKIGENHLSVSVESEEDDDTEQTRFETDGGREVAPRE